NYWRCDGYIALPDGDLAVAVFTFGANTASAEDGIYLIHAHAMIGSALTYLQIPTQVLTLYIYMPMMYTVLQDCITSLM
ncbi:hypothetical protein BDR05DRAFT_963043, partial [Suillus weaverae]